MNEAMLVEENQRLRGELMAAKEKLQRYGVPELTQQQIDVIEAKRAERLRVWGGYSKSNTSGIFAELQTEEIKEMTVEELAQKTLYIKALEDAGVPLPPSDYTFTRNETPAQKQRRKEYHAAAAKVRDSQYADGAVEDFAGGLYDCEPTLGMKSRQLMGDLETGIPFRPGAVIDVPPGQKFVEGRNHIVAPVSVFGDFVKELQDLGTGAAIQCAIAFARRYGVTEATADEPTIVERKE